MVPLAAPLAPEQALAGPDEGRGVGVPAARRRFKPVDDVVWGGRGLTGERPVDKDALDRLGHVQPGAAQRGVQWHDAVLNQPQHESWGLVAAEIVQDQQHPQGWQAFGQSEPDGESLLPPLPDRAALRLGLRRRLRQRRQDCRHLTL